MNFQDLLKLAVPIEQQAKPIVLPTEVGRAERRGCFLTIHSPDGDTIGDLTVAISKEANSPKEILQSIMDVVDLLLPEEEVNSNILMTEAGKLDLTLCYNLLIAAHAKYLVDNFKQIKRYINKDGTTHREQLD